MKDIKREVDALEVAMQVATDIKDKPYAYVVARIQEALLGNSELILPAPTWAVEVTKGKDNTSRLWISRVGLLYSCLLIPEKYILYAKAFCMHMETIQKGGSSVTKWSVHREEMKIRFSHSGSISGQFTLYLDTAGSYPILDSLIEFVNNTKTSE